MRSKSTCRFRSTSLGAGPQDDRVVTYAPDREQPLYHIGSSGVFRMTRHCRSDTSRARFRRRLLIESLESRIALSDSGQPYDIGTPTLTDVWVDPVHGSDGNSGAARDQAVQSLKEAWARIPAQTPLTTTGYRILLTAGDYATGLLPDNGWMSERAGTASCPILIESVDGPLAARLHGTLDAQQDS